MTFDISIISIIFVHFILDFPLQGDFLAKNKSTNMLCMIAHCLIYAGGMTLLMYFLGLPTYVFTILLISHFVIDMWKTIVPENEQMGICFWIDQVGHITFSIILFILLG